MNKYKSSFLIILTSIFFVFFVDSAMASENSLVLEGYHTPEALKTFFYDSKSKTLSGTYEYKETSISIEVIRGDLKPEIMRNDPDSIQYLIDVGLFDNLGDLFLVKSGGGPLINKDWYENYNRADENIDGERNNSDDHFLAAINLIKILKETRFKPELFPEYRSIINLLPTLQEVYGTPKEVYEIPNRWEWSRSIALHKKTYAAVGEHSGSVAKQWNSSIKIKVWLECNYGACPNESPMRKYCERTFYGNEKVPQVNRYCMTPYGLEGVQHTCNDCTKYQYLIIKLNRLPYDAYSGTCSDGMKRIWAPSCS